jgi:hypothetical protein
MTPQIAESHDASPGRDSLALCHTQAGTVTPAPITGAIPAKPATPPGKPNGDNSSSVDDSELELELEGAAWSLSQCFNFKLKPFDLDSELETPPTRRRAWVTRSTAGLCQRRVSIGAESESALQVAVGFKFAASGRFDRDSPASCERLRLEEPKTATLNLKVCLPCFALPWISSSGDRGDHRV